MRSLGYQMYNQVTAVMAHLSCRRWKEAGIVPEIFRYAPGVSCIYIEQYIQEVILCRMIR